jgi:hypothetical protein
MKYHDPNHIIRVTADVHGLAENAIRDKGNKRVNSDARRQAISIIARDRMFILQDIGDMFGGRDYTTVINLIKTHKELMTDKAYRSMFLQVLQILGIDEVEWEYQKSYRFMQQYMKKSQSTLERDEDRNDVITAYGHDGNVILCSYGYRLNKAMRAAFKELMERGFVVTSKHNNELAHFITQAKVGTEPVTLSSLQVYAGKIILQPCRA